MDFIQLLYTIPTTAWKNYNESRRAKAFMKLLLYSLANLVIMNVIYGVVFVLEVIDIMKGTDLLDTKNVKNHAPLKNKVITP